MAQHFTDKQIEHIAASVNLPERDIDCLKVNLRSITFQIGSSDEAEKNVIDGIHACVLKRGTHVGVIMGQSLGQPITQMALSSFKKTGSSEFGSMPQLRGVLRWSESNSRAVTILRIKKGIPQDQEHMKIYLRSIRSVKVSDILEKIRPTKDGVVLNFDNSKRFDLRLNISRIVDIMSQKLRLEAVVTSEIFGVMTIKVGKDPKSRDSGSTSKLSSLMNFDNNERSQDSRDCNITRTTLSNILDLKISGIDMISDASIDRDSVKAVGPRFKDLMSFGFVDPAKSECHDVWETYRTLGIEATRAVIIDRIQRLAGVDDAYRDRNVCLLADQMCCRGVPLRVDKRGLKAIGTGFYRELSFESGIQVLRKVVTSTEDLCLDPSSKIIVGKPLDSF
jgi:hypothetical protein